jgi:hypothetical protein
MSDSQPKLIYLATPYTSTHSMAFMKLGIEQTRFEHACIIAARLFREGYHVYSPIAASHGIARHGRLGGDWQTWKSYDERMISLCDELWVATEMTGWDQSVGVAAEIAFARSIGKPVVFYKGEYHD